jgi:hypothetical protein
LHNPSLDLYEEHMQTPEEDYSSQERCSSSSIGSFFEESTRKAKLPDQWSNKNALYHNYDTFTQEMRLNMKSFKGLIPTRTLPLF